MGILLFMANGVITKEDMIDRDDEWGSWGRKGRVDEQNEETCEKMRKVFEGPKIKR